MIPNFQVNIFNSEDFDVLHPWRSVQPSDEALKRWRSACAIIKNRRRRFPLVANLTNHAEGMDNKRQEKLRDLFRAKRAALPFFDVAPSEYVTTYIPHDFQKAALDFTRSPDDVLSGYKTQTRRFQEFVDDMGSIIKGHELKLMKCTNAVFSLRVGNLLTYTVLKATSFGVYLLSHLVFKAFSSVRNIFSNLLLGVAFVRHKFQYYMSLRKYIVTEAAKVRRMQDCLNDVEYVSHDHDDDDNDDDDDFKDHPISVIMQPVYNVSPNGKFRRRIMSWQKGELLGSGSFGSVYEGLTEKSDRLHDENSMGFWEISLLSRFEHDNIVQYLGTDKDENRLYIFLELVRKGSLANLYQRYHLRDSQVSSYTRQILNGLIYLHDQNVMFQDIKCANILVDASGSVKLADFGLAKVVNLKNDGYGLTADIWSLGCTVLEMITHRPPYSHLEGKQALFRIGRGALPPVPNSLSRDARDFILKCLQVNPNDRPTAAQLMEHPFVKRPLQISRGSLAASPN
ncbi:hypothetical protein WN943_005855 [Citrus x changshan-huyou]